MGLPTFVLVSVSQRERLTVQTKPCVRCGGEFPKNPKYGHKQWADAKYCSTTCQQPATYATYKCAGCGKPVEKRVARAKWKSVVCSTECANNAMRRPRGKEFAKKWFNKISGRWMVSWRIDESPVTYKAPFSRWVWEMENGPIPPGAQIHHRNGDKTDDRLENLQLAMNDAEHKEIHYGERYRSAPDGAAERKCTQCNEFKPVEKFHTRRTRSGTSFLVSPCRDCTNSHRRRRRAAHRQRCDEGVSI